jgi:predicted transcriptional regulator
MSESPSVPLSGEIGSAVRTLAVRLSDDMRAQLDIIAAVNDRSVTEEIRQALLDWIARSKADPTLAERAEGVRAAIEREAQARRDEIERGAQSKRDAIDALFAPAKPAPKPSKRAEPAN